jgi:AraC family transcriptional regulator, ethanolamine operon transcriptional activator
MCETVVRRSFSEFSELQAGLQTLCIKGVSMEREEFHGSVCAINYCDLSVEIVRTGPALLLSGAERGRAGYLLLLDGARGAKWDGRSVDGRDVARLRGDSALAASFSVPTTFAFLSTDAKTDEEVFGFEPQSRPKSGSGASVQRAPALAHERLSAIVRCAEQALLSEDGEVLDQEAGLALRTSMIGAAQALVRSDGGTPKSRHRAAGRQRVVRAVDEYLCANPMRPIYTEDLCNALGVSPSALHEAFHTVFGTSPHRYLKLRRMSLVRAALLSRSGPWASVKAAALSYGFWHLGQFAQDYKETFGELPSATLGRAKSAA